METKTELIESEAALLEEVAKIIKLSPKGSLILLRGQTELFPELKSGKSRNDIVINQEVENGWNALIGRFLSSAEQPKISKEMRQAILQHYGMFTYYLDFTTSPIVAAWFASNQYEKLKSQIFVGMGMRNIDRVTYKRLVQGVGYIAVLIIDNPAELIKNKKLLDISTTEKFVRPKRQQAQLLYDRKPLLPDANSFWKHTIKIDRTKFVSSLSMRELFPSPQDDSGYKKLLEVPYVQIPMSLLDRPGEASNETIKPAKEDNFFDDFCFSKRAVEILEYVENEKDDGGINHKWADYTLFEPTPFRNWVKYGLDLNKETKFFSGNFHNCHKITISPQVKKFIENIHDDVFKDWPHLDTTDIFFTYSQLEHDKVLDLQPPFIGIWLHKESDLILALQFDSDGTNMKPKLLAVFLLEDGEILLQKMKGIKYPLNTKPMLEMLCGLLSIHQLVKNGNLALVPHPIMFPHWYILI